MIKQGKAVLPLRGDMSSPMGSVEFTRFKEAEYKRQKNEVSNLKEGHEKEYNTVSKKQEEDLARLKKEYTQIADREENTLIRKLNELKNKHIGRLKLENQRLDDELRDLKAAHQDQVNELKETQSTQLKNMNEEFENRLYLAKQKFDKSMAKYQTDS